MSRATVLSFLLVLGAAATAAAADVERFVDSDEAKDRAYRQGCAITDYHDLVTGDGVDWAWVRSGARVGAPGPVEMKPIRNYSDVTDPEIGTKVEKDFRQALERIGKSVGRGGLVATACVFWMDRFNNERAMVPFAGMHLMQAGIGVEVTITDPGGTVLAKVRDSGRQGKDPEEAAAVVVDRIVNYLRDH